MIKVRTHLIVLAAALTALLVLPAAAPASASPTPSPYSSPAADASASAGSSSPLVYRIGLQSDVDNMNPFSTYNTCLLYTSDAADDLLCVDLGGRRIIKKKKKKKELITKT